MESLTLTAWPALSLIPSDLLVPTARSWSVGPSFFGCSLLTHAMDDCTDGDHNAKSYYYSGDPNGNLFHVFVFCAVEWLYCM